MIKSFGSQFRTVLLIELLLISMGLGFALLFWDVVCSASVVSCLREQELSLLTFFFLAFFRPFVFTPWFVFVLMAGNGFGPQWGTVIAAVGAMVSTVGLYVLAKAVGKKVVRPWLRANFPQTLLFARSQDWKIVLLVRAIPIFPFDLATICFGLADFHYQRVMWATFIGSLPEAYVLAKFADPASTLLGSTITLLIVVFVFILLPGFIFEFLWRKQGKGLWVRLAAVKDELLGEVRLNNAIIKRHSHQPGKIPILLLYGFFSSRKVMTILERHLTSRGYEVLSFNLGGLLGTFFTKSITETAEFIDYKLKRQFSRHGFHDIYIVSHSKGGLVACWWLLKLGGYKHCKKLITMGTPFRGTVLTWLALMTPIGFLFRSMWQMRPGSLFLKLLRQAEIPGECTIYNLYSDKDKVAPGKNGVLSFDHPRVKEIPMHTITHFGFLYKKEVTRVIAKILGPSHNSEHLPK